MAKILTSESRRSARPQSIWSRNSAKGLADLGDAWRRRDLVFALAWNDIARRYRGSLLGPLWVTVTLGIKIATLAAIYPSLTGASLAQYVPFVTVGFIIWMFISGAISDASFVFISAAAYTKQIRLSFSIPVAQVILRNYIIFAHHMVIFVIVSLIFQIVPTWQFLFLIPALILMGWIVGCITIILGMLSARFRDVPEAVNSVVQVFFFVTPIFWQPTGSQTHRLLILLNPFSHAIEIARAPMLGQSFPTLSWLFMVVTAIFLGCVSFIMFARYRARINLWV